jgi:preprotein translocase SecE subunit
MVKIKKPGLRSKKIETIRERADKKRHRQTTDPRHKRIVTATISPIKSFGKLLSKEYNPIKVKNGRYSKLLSKKVRFIPKYFISSISEVEQVKWPTLRQALSLTFAVIMFSATIALFVQILGFGFDKLFKEVILK